VLLSLPDDDDDDDDDDAATDVDGEAEGTSRKLVGSSEPRRLGGVLRCCEDEASSWLQGRMVTLVYGTCLLQCTNQEDTRYWTEVLLYHDVKDCCNILHTGG
jgi:hypothetical protein